MAVSLSVTWSGISNNSPGLLMLNPILAGGLFPDTPEQECHRLGAIKTAVQVLSIWANAETLQHFTNAHLHCMMWHICSALRRELLCTPISEAGNDKCSLRQELHSTLSQGKEKSKPCVCLGVLAGRPAAADHEPWQHTGTPPSAAEHLTCWPSPAQPCRHTGMVLPW